MHLLVPSLSDNFNSLHKVLVQVSKLRFHLPYKYINEQYNPVSKMCLAFDLAKLVSLLQIKSRLS